jgi:hypothetical protein
MLSGKDVHGSGQALHGAVLQEHVLAFVYSLRTFPVQLMTLVHQEETCLGAK